MKTISGTEAINKMRAVCMEEHASFELYHLKFNRKDDTAIGLRRVKKCRLRAALPDDYLEGINPDHYLTYIDLELHEPRMAWKKLIRMVAFAPDFEPLKVSWFNIETNGSN